MNNPESSVRKSQLIRDQRRSELFLEFEKVHQPYCHKSMSKQYIETGRSFRMKDNRIQLRNPSLHGTTIFKTNYPIIQHSHNSYQNTDATKTMWKTAMLTYKNNQQLNKIKSSSISKEQSHPPIANVNFGQMSKGHILGSHSKSSNPGYSRNKSGGFYTR